ncbi:MAG: SUMF1/EgtB/PvdO family nonheme iron enzyme [Kiritimatiellae bacterium]|nr:SUMF1/EgtB/PvdO family nonheme iron enzyme [Kiritimatiellia bacterium]
MNTKCDGWLRFVAAAVLAGTAVVANADAVCEERAAQVKLMNAAALTRLADDWAKMPNANAVALAALRQFAVEVEGAKRAALDALGRGDAAPAAALVARQRRLMAAHPRLRGIEVLAVKHAAPGNPGAARREGNPAQPGLSCYNHLDVWKGRRAGLVAYSGFDGETPVERKVIDHSGTIHAVDLEFDGSRILFVGPDRARSNQWRLFETDVKGTTPKTLLPTNFIHEVADCCWLPDGRIVFTSDAGEQGLPCETGRVRMSNSYRLDPRTGVVERLTYDQDSNWYPSVLNDGRVLYVRWEYCDLPHFFSRLLMTMNPDGTRQMGFYGSNDYWPNHFGSPLAIPGDNGKFICVATGHHASKAGKLVLFDAERASAGPAGAVQMLPGWGKQPEGRIEDGLYNGQYPRFLQPFPLGSCPDDGAGKFFLAAMKASPSALWGIYLVDIFDNITLLAEVEGWCLNEPIAICARKRPPAIPDKRRVNVPYATIYCGDLYQGEGLKGVPKGTVKEARIFAYHYAFNKSGSHEAVGLESSWDIKYVLGTVPVTEDGGILFDAPVNTPISIQPLDENGCALQLMRSWTVGMPGEYVSCVGCHEKPSVAARPLKMVMRAPSKIKPPEGRDKPRTWSFLREIQPILQRRCSGCHDKDADPMVASRKPDYQGVKVFASSEHGPFLRGDKPNLADITPIAIQCKSGGGSRQGGVDVRADNKDTDWSGAWSKSYVELVAYVRRPGPESDYRLFNPMEYHANTSPLVQLLKSGHHGVTLTDDEWRRIYTWIDLNAPFWGTWKDVAEWFRKRGDRAWAGSGRNHNEQLRLLEASHQRRQYGESRFQGFWDPKNDPELDRYGIDQAQKDLALIKFEPPKRTAPQSPAKTPVVLDPKSVAGYGTRMEIDAPGGKLVFRKVEKRLWMCESELPLANYLAFKPDHYNGVIDWVGKDHQNEGERVLRGDQSAIRVSFAEAKAYAKWLSEKTGFALRLPTEDEWERAARAGRKGDYAWDGEMAEFAKVANLSDVSVGRLPNQFNVMNPHQRFEGANDGEMIVGSALKHRYQPNAAGLYDMIGNVEEWCAGPKGEAVARGAAFNILPRRATFGRRNQYLEWQRVFNVGIRLVMERSE